MGNRYVIKEVLVIGDDELNCDCEKLTIEDMNINNIGFSNLIVDRFEMIIYEGKKGTKILKSNRTKTGIVK